MTSQGNIRASVIVPAFNAERFVGEAIASVLAQSEPRCEILVVDDASTDATAAAVARLADRDARVRLLRNPVNRGPAGARNRGLAAARGDWIVLLDADDTFLPHRIETLLSLGEQHAADIVADNLLLCPEGGEAPCRPMLSQAALPRVGWLSAAAFVAGNIGSRWTPRVSYGFLQPAIRRAFLAPHGLGYNEHSRFGEDFMLYLACLLCGARWLMTPEAMYRYRVRWGSLTDIQSAADLGRIRAMEAELLRTHPAVAADPELARALRRHKRKIDHFYHYRRFADAVRAGAPAQALRVMFASLGAFANVASEGLLQTPRIARKAMRGGYRGMRGAAPHPRMPS